MFKNTLPKENIYGHINRIKWIKQFINKNDKIMEFGCGTGYMITYPLRCEGYNIEGYDLDAASIEYGINNIFTDDEKEKCIKALDIRELQREYDVVIASEVLEHIPDNELDEIIRLLKNKIKPGGKLLLTVPNGYGWFELESFIWNKMGIGILLTKSKIINIITILKNLMIGKYTDANHPSTLSSSPHVHRFTFNSIQKRLIKHGFEIIEARGSVLFCGPFSNMLFTGIKPVMDFNIWLGKKFPSLASGIYISARKIS